MLFKVMNWLKDSLSIGWQSFLFLTEHSNSEDFWKRKIKQEIVTCLVILKIPEGTEYFLWGFCSLSLLLQKQNRKKKKSGMRDQLNIRRSIKNYSEKCFLFTNLFWTIWLLVPLKNNVIDSFSIYLEA